MLAGLIWKNLPELKNQSDMLVHGSTDHMKANVMHSPSVRETVPNAEKLRVVRQKQEVTDSAVVSAGPQRQLRF